MRALTNAKELKDRDGLNKIAAAGLCNYGVNSNKLYEQLLSFAETISDESSLIAALDNADTQQQLLKVFETDREKVFEGMAVIGYLTGVKNLKLILPEKQKELAAELETAAKAYGIEVAAEFVNVRENRENLILHIMTMLDLYDLFCDEYDAGIYLVLDEQIKKLSGNTKIKDIIDVSEAKALQLGYDYHAPQDAELALEAVKIENGVIRVLKQDQCIVSETAIQLRESMAQSCGKCVFCREGLIQLHYMQKEIVEGRGKKEYTDLSNEIGQAMSFSTLCSMGQLSARMPLTALEGFSAEYDSHVKKKVCPAGVCASFTSIYIDPRECTGCGECVDVCPADCIEGKAKFIHMIDEFDCTKCGKCIGACDEGAIHETTGKVPKLPNRLTKVGRFKRR